MGGQATKGARSRDSRLDRESWERAPPTSIRSKFMPSRVLLAKTVANPGPPAPPGRHRRTRAERLARQLALAHWIDRAVESGEAASYADVARAVGLEESRITQVTALLGLSPAIQEAILLGKGGTGIREAIRVGREVEWEKQAAPSKNSTDSSDPVLRS